MCLVKFEMKPKLLLVSIYYFLSLHIFSAHSRFWRNGLPLKSWLWLEKRKKIRINYSFSSWLTTPFTLILANYNSLQSVPPNYNFVKNKSLIQIWTLKLKKSVTHEWHVTLKHFLVTNLPWIKMYCIQFLKRKKMQR
jgi:hypothetical protein